MIRAATIALLAMTLPAAAQTFAPSSSFAARFASLASLQDTRPALRTAIRISGDVVRIGDLVENAGALAAVPVFRAPDLGQTGSVPVSRVLEVLAPHALGEIDTRGASEIVVTRNSRAVAPADIETRIIRALAGRHRGAEEANLTLSFDAEPLAFHTEPEIELRIARMSFDPRSGRFDAVFEVPGAARRYLRFTGSYVETFEAAVLARPVPAGVALKVSDLKLMRRPKSEYAANIVTDISLAVGLAARQPMRPGQLLRQTDLVKPEVVARNETVTITYHVPGITLTMRGKALEAGAQGDIVGVMNMQSQRTIQATITGPGRVTMSPPSPPEVLSAAPRPTTEARVNVHPHAHVRAQ